MHPERASRIGRWTGWVGLVLATVVLSLVVMDGPHPRIAEAVPPCTPADDFPPEPSDGPVVDGDAGGDAIDIEELSYTAYRRGAAEDADDVAYIVRLSDPLCWQYGMREARVLDGALRREAWTRSQDCDAVSSVLDDPTSAPSGFDFDEARKFTASSLCARTAASSITPAGVPSSVSYPRRPSVSAIGWHIAFSSATPNLVADDTNGFEDVFVRDNHSYLTERVSAPATGGQADGNSFFPTMSADGGSIAFASYAGNLVANDSNGALDVFVRDRGAGATSLISVSSAGVAGNGPSGATGVSMSANGQRVAFASSATNLRDGGLSTAGAVYVRDRASGTTTLVSRSSAGGAVAGSSPALSPDGRFVAFTSASAAIVPGDTNGKADIFVFDMNTAETRIVSVGLAGAPANGWSDFSTISADGRNVAFESTATNLTQDPADPLSSGTPRQVYVADLVQGETRCISLNLQGQLARSNSVRPAMSFSGRYIAFESQADDLVVGDSNVYAIGGPADLGSDIFVFDVERGELQLVSVDAGGSAKTGRESFSGGGARGWCGGLLINRRFGVG